MSQDPSLPSYETPLADKNGNTSKNWYFFFSQLLSSFTGGVTKIIAGTNVTISPTTGVGNVTVNSSGGAGITDITSTGGTVSISNPTGPTVNLEVTAGTGTVTSVTAASSHIVIGGTPTVAPTVDLSATDKTNSALAATALQSTSLTDSSTTPIYNTATTAGASTLTLKTETANTVFAGPNSGSAAQPGFRTLVAADLAALFPSLAVPGTIPDLQFWWESDNILGASGAVISRLQERTPWIGGLAASASSANGGAVAIDSTLLNSLPVLKWPAVAVSGQYAIPSPVGTSAVGAVGFSFINGATYFIVAKGANSAATQAVLGGVNGCLALYLVSVAGTAKIGLVKTGASVIGSSSTAWTAGTFFQANVTYNTTSGAFVFRQGRATAGSGSGAAGAGALVTEQTNLLGGDVGNSSLLNACSLAAIIAYNRVLSGTEITNVENYLFAKWGV